MTRRQLALHVAGAAAAIPVLTEAALAQRAAVPGALPPGTVFLNANENPEGPPKEAIEAMIEVLPSSGRYHYQEYQEFYATVAKSEGMAPEQLLIGSGSSEILQAAVHAFTSEKRPMVQIYPTYESVAAVVEALNRKVVRVPLTASYTADVKAIAEAAGRENAGLIYLCNPNNPTATVTPKKDIEWLVSNLPGDTVLLLDEAYIHFAETPEMESAFRYVNAGKNVVVARSYSKIWGMAGLRAGAGYARPDLIKRMEPFRNNVISIVAVRALLGGLSAAGRILPERRARYNGIRREVCLWLASKDVRYIEPHANFLMIDMRRDARPLLPKMIARGVAPGRHFPPMTDFMRVSVGTASDMEKFRKAFWEVYSS
jgi:histidinol-phosphate aminotransferase